MNQETLIEKIRKLNAKATDKSVTEEEAALYAQKVAQLLQQHNLTEATLDVKEDVQEVGEDRMFNSKTGDPWAQSLGDAVAQLYFCAIYLRTDGEGRKKICFVGKPHNVEIAMSMTGYLIKTIGRLANTYAKTPEAKADFDWTFTRARNGFERGAGIRMYSRIIKMVQEQTLPEPMRSTTGSPANLPALYQDEKKLVGAYLDSMNLRKGRGRGSDTSGGHAEAGRRAADGISLNTQVGGKGRRMLS